MQVINKSTNSILVFTLSEKVTITNPYFLFSLKGQTEMNPKNFIVTDTSGFPTRYNQFLVTETSGAENLTSGVVTLGDTGFYEYAIYEQASASNLSLVDTGAVLEIGLINVVGTPGTYKEYDNQTKTIITYGE